MSKSLKPQKINEDAWYYENDRTIEVHVDVRDFGGNHVKHVVLSLPISKLVKSIKRCYKPARRLRREAECQKKK